VLFFYPELFVHFKIESISSSFYASSWFITLFSSALQSSKSGKIPKMLLYIWDIFLIYKWKGVYKISLFIIK